MNNRFTTFLSVSCLVNFRYGPKEAGDMEISVDSDNRKLTKQNQENLFSLTKEPKRKA